MTPRTRGILLGAAVLFISGAFFSILRLFSLPKEPVSAEPSRSAEPIAGTSREPKVIFAKAEKARIGGSYGQARGLYQETLELNPDPQTAAAAQERLGEMNVKILLSPARGEGEAFYTIKPGDTLARIAREHKITLDLLKAANGLQGDFIRAGQKLRVPEVSFSVIVDKSQNTLTLKQKEEIFKVYRCSTGAGGITPTGDFRIANRLKDPVWKGVVPPGSPGNPLGSRWLGFDLPEYGIHGTNKPETIGQPVTKGCVRLVNSDVEELFVLLPEGTRVTIME